MKNNLINIDLESPRFGGEVLNSNNPNNEIVVKSDKSNGDKEKNIFDSVSDKIYDYNSMFILVTKPFEDKCFKIVLEENKLSESKKEKSDSKLISKSNHKKNKSENNSLLSPFYCNNSIYNQSKLNNKTFNSNKNFYTVEEVASHKYEYDIWMILNGEVYDLTSYLNKHPGGAKKLLLAAGKDGTELFNKYHHYINYKQFIGDLHIGYLSSKR